MGQAVIYLVQGLTNPALVLVKIGPQRQVRQLLHNQSTGQCAVLMASHAIGDGPEAARAPVKQRILIALANLANVSLTRAVPVDHSCAGRAKPRSNSGSKGLGARWLCSRYWARIPPMLARSSRASRSSWR